MLCRAAAPRACEKREPGQGLKQQGDRIGFASHKELPGYHGEKGLGCWDESRSCEETTTVPRQERLVAQSGLLPLEAGEVGERARLNLHTAPAFLETEN